jgi:hypothetical protein
MSHVRSVSPRTIIAANAAAIKIESTIALKRWRREQKPGNQVSLGGKLSLGQILGFVP